MSAMQMHLWNDAQRWEQAHLLLSLDVALPLYEYIGLPFRNQASMQFHVLSKAYVTEALMNRAPVTAAEVPGLQQRLLVALDNAFGEPLRKAYFDWFIKVYVGDASEHDDGWYEWQTIFMRCSVREGWWSHLGLPDALSATVAGELAACKEQRNDARALDTPIDPSSASAWDQAVMKRLMIGAESIANGEPFTRLILTSNFYNFALFFQRLPAHLKAPELDALWERGKLIAPSVEVDPQAVVHPAALRLVRASSW